MAELDKLNVSKKARALGVHEAILKDGVRQIAWDLFHQIENRTIISINLIFWKFERKWGDLRDEWERAFGPEI